MGKSYCKPQIERIELEVESAYMGLVITSGTPKP